MVSKCEKRRRKRIAERTNVAGVIHCIIYLFYAPILVAPLVYSWTSGNHVPIIVYSAAGILFLMIGVIISNKSYLKSHYVKKHAYLKKPFCKKEKYNQWAEYQLYQNFCVAGILVLTFLVCGIAIFW